MLGVRNITNDLGVLNVTVWRWIKEGKIKATMVNRRIGWRIEDEEYARFLEENPRYQMVHEGQLYTRSEIQARENALIGVLSRVIASKGTVKEEGHSKEYMDGFNRAINDITEAVNKEIRKKAPDSVDSRSEQIA